MIRGPALVVQAEARSAKGIAQPCRPRHGAHDGASRRRCFDVCRMLHIGMPVARRGRRLKRKAFFVDEAKLRRAKRALGAKTDADVVRLSIDRVIEMEQFRTFMDGTRKSLPAGSFSEV